MRREIFKKKIKQSVFSDISGAPIEVGDTLFIESMRHEDVYAFVVENIKELDEDVRDLEVITLQSRNNTLGIGTRTVITLNRKHEQKGVVFPSLRRDLANLTLSDWDVETDIFLKKYLTSPDNKQGTAKLTEAVIAMSMHGLFDIDSTLEYDLRKSRSKLRGFVNRHAQTYQIRGNSIVYVGNSSSVARGYITASDIVQVAKEARQTIDVDIAKLNKGIRMILESFSIFRVKG